jgi:LPXTG-site transpeptidase (sortase) family protein
MPEGQFTALIRRDIYEHRHKLGFSFVLIFMFSLVTLSSVGLIPEPIPESENNVHVTAATSHSRTPEGMSLLHDAVEAENADMTPRRVVVESVGIDTNVLTPTRTDITILDNALLEGAVLYPGSGDLGATSNLFIFGHSSHLAVVNNLNFKAFNNLERVKVGETIRVESSDVVNVYKVTSVKKVKAEDAFVALSNDRKMLTLSTCNSFGAPSDRFVVEAEFSGSYELARPVGVILTNSSF